MRVREMKIVNHEPMISGELFKLVNIEGCSDGVGMSAWARFDGIVKHTRPSFVRVRVEVKTKPLKVGSAWLWPLDVLRTLDSKYGKQFG
jgi:hypothetical protein